MTGAPPEVDPWANPPTAIIDKPGSAIMYRAASGLECALADTGGQRLIEIYAEIIRDQWNPWQISAHNLPYLAWAMGVNLWEDWWDENTKRQWVARQWELKSYRGTRVGLEEFVKAVGGKVKRVITPPSFFYGGKALTDEERAAYVARFAQLRIYPFVEREKLGYLCFLNGPFFDQVGNRQFTRNGGFLPMFPTNQDQGGSYTRTATLWDHGVETPLTVRKVVNVDPGPEDVTIWDQVELPGHLTNKYFVAQAGKFPRPAGGPLTGFAKHGIFLGKLDTSESMTVKIPRDGSLDVLQGKAQYQTVLPDDNFISVYPEHVSEVCPRRRCEIYAAKSNFIMGGSVGTSFLPKSDAWRYVFERWYLFDTERVPDPHKASIYMGNARFGIPKYTAEAKIELYGKLKPRTIYIGGYLNGVFRRKDNEVIERLRRATRASKRLVDTILIDTQIKRVVEVRDLNLADGTHFVGELVSD